MFLTYSKRIRTILRCARCVFEVFVEVFLIDFLSFYNERGVFPFGLYIILKRSWDTSLAHAHSAQRAATLGNCSIVPGARVPKGHAFAKRRPDRCMPCPSFCLALLRAYVINMQFCRRPFSCPSFCLALSLSGPDEMFGQAKWQ